MKRVPLEEVHAAMACVLRQAGFSKTRADLCGRLMAENMRDGVYSHGLNRLPALLASIEQGHVDVDAEPERVGGLGVVEQWDGHRGPGPLAAHTCMGRAVALAREHGLGCVGLRNTNHWMRAGAYGLQATRSGCVGICFTNTLPLMRPYGGTETRIGNNPLVVAVPGPDGAVLLDMALSQYSLGKLEVCHQQGCSLDVAGGYDEAGNLTRDPAAILASGNALPIGGWKGAGLVVMLDLLSALVSGGQTTHQIGQQEAEYGVSQVFVAIDVARLAGPSRMSAVVREVVADIESAIPADPERPVRCPGTGMRAIRAENLARGVPVEEAQWAWLQGKIDRSGVDS